MATSSAILRLVFGIISLLLIEAIVVYLIYDEGNNLAERSRYNSGIEKHRCSLRNCQPGKSICDGWVCYHYQCTLSLLDAPGHLSMLTPEIDARIRMTTPIFEADDLPLSSECYLNRYENKISLERIPELPIDFAFSISLLIFALFIGLFIFALGRNIHEEMYPNEEK